MPSASLSIPRDDDHPPGSSQSHRLRDHRPRAPRRHHPAFYPLLPIGGPFGYWDAKRDISRGLYAYNVPLWNFGWEKEWQTFLQDTYGLRLRARTHSCFHSVYLDTYDSAYNRVQLAAIRERFCYDVITSSRNLIRKEWELKAAARAQPSPPVRFSPMLSKAQLADIYAIRMYTPNPLPLPVK